MVVQMLNGDGSILGGTGTLAHPMPDGVTLVMRQVFGESMGSSELRESILRGDNFW
jgi:hypothetical protein